MRSTPSVIGKVFRNLLHHALVKSLEQGHTLLETLAEINLAPHGTLGDGLDLIADAGTQASSSITSVSISVESISKHIRRRQRR